MAWFYIIFADLFEIAWSFVLKRSAPISRWAPLFVGIICSVPVNYLLAEAVKHLPAATVYATFVGIGTEQMTPTNSGAHLDIGADRFNTKGHATSNTSAKMI